MIEKMKAVCVVSEYSQKEKLLGALSDMGVLHVAEKKAAEFAVLERFSELSRIISELKAYSSEGEEAAELLSDKQFEEIYKATLAALDKKAALTAKTSELKLEIEKLRPWGEFDTSAIRSLPADLDFHFYQLDKKAYKDLEKDENVRFIRLASVEQMEAVAVIGQLDGSVNAIEFVVPERDPRS